MNNYELNSFIPLQASTSQYDIDHNAPIKLTLHGSRSCCHLRAIQEPKLKEILANVGIEFERVKENKFFNFIHTFLPTETSESNKGNSDLVKDIFVFVKEAINNQTNGKLTLDLTDMTQLVVQKAEDRTTQPPCRAYELVINLSEKAVETAEKSGLIFREYLSFQPQRSEDIPYILGVGEAARTRF